MKKALKTTTIGSEGDPALTILEGRHTRSAFVRAMKVEGWKGVDEDAEIGYEWLKKTKAGYKVSSIRDLKAEIYTVMEWW